MFDHDENIQVLNSPGTFSKCLVLNINAPAEQMTIARKRLSDIRLRQALSLAIDQEALISFVLNDSGKTISPGLIPVSNADLYNEQTELNRAPIEERLRQANALLDEIAPEKDASGYRYDLNGRYSFVILAAPGDQDTVAYLQVLFQKIGIEVTYAASGASPESTYLYGGNFDMTLQSVILNTSNIDVMYNSHFVSLGKSSNYGRLSVPEISSGVTAMRTTLNRNLKFAMIRDLEVQIAQQYYKLPLYCANVISVARTDHFTGWVEKDGSNAFGTESLQNLVLVKK